MDRHFEGEQIFLQQGSKQSDIWESIDTEEYLKNLFKIERDLGFFPFF